MVDTIKLILSASIVGPEARCLVVAARPERFLRLNSLAGAGR